MDDSDIERELTEAQADVTKARSAPRRRRKAVMLARSEGWSKYKIAATLGVKAPTVDSIIEAAEREQGER
jgi:DNA-directed RNA polymerase specialized sigma24 family protein